MNRIYLDTSNIALLTKIKENDSQRFQRFLNKWRSKNFILAISNAHLFEIMRHSSTEERVARFNLLENLLPIRYEPLVVEKEIILALLQKGAIINKFLSISFFTEKILTPTDLIGFRGLDNPLMRDIYNLNYDAYQTTWNMEIDESKLGDFRTTRFSSIPENAISQEELRDFIDKLKPILQENTKSIFEKYENIPDEAAEIGNNLVIEALESFFNRSSQVGLKEAFAEFIEIDSTDNKTQRTFVDKHLNGFNFKINVESTVQEQLGITDAEDIEFLKNSILPENCPGFWLKTQIRNRLLKANLIGASNELDIHHLSHLPYVNMLFTDKRIVEMTKQVFNSNDLLKLLRNTNMPISIPNTIEALESALFI